MDKFNEWFDSEYPNFSSNQDNEFCKTAKDYAYAGFQSRQAEVDQLEEWNSNQAQSIKSYQEEDEAMKELLQKLIDDEYTTMRPSMAYEIQKVLRGEHE